MVLDTETVFLLHFKAEIWREGDFKGGHFKIQDGRRLPWQPRWEAAILFSRSRNEQKFINTSKLTPKSYRHYILHNYP